MQLLLRHTDVLTGAASLEDLHSFPAFPVFMGCVTHPRSEDILAELTWQISRTTGVLQLKELVPLDILYQEQHDAGVTGDLWRLHHKAFADFLGKQQPTGVLEIGGAHGILAMEYMRLGRIPWTVLEPNPAPVTGCTARFIKGFFNESFAYPDPFDTVVHSHVFEHIYEPDAFIEQLARLMSIGKTMVFSIPNMQIMLERRYTNCINFEHTVFLTEPYVEYLLARHGFRISATEYFREDHSIFYAAIREQDVIPVELSDQLYERNKRLYLDYVEYHAQLIEQLNARLREISTSVYLFGAHVFAQYLIQMGLNTNSILGLLDNAPAKQGKRLYGTDLFVSSPAVLRGLHRPVVILRAGVYNDEIKQDILGNINPETRFLE